MGSYHVTLAQYQNTLFIVAFGLAVLLVCGIIRASFQAGREYQSYLERHADTLPPWKKGGWLP